MLHWFRNLFTRSSLLFFGGALGVIYETVIIHGAAQPDLLILFAAMMGLPAFLGPAIAPRHEDEEKSSKNKKDKDTD